MQLKTTLSGSAHDSDSQRMVLDELEAHFEEIYVKFIQAGFRHLKEIRYYPDWNVDNQECRVIEQVRVVCCTAM